MKFDHEVHEAVHQRVEHYLTELFDQPIQEEEDGHFYVRYGSTVLEISIDAHGTDDAVVVVMAYCVQDVSLDDDLLLALLELNHRIPFGAFSLVGNDVFVRYSLLGHNLDRASLLAAITNIATISDDWDDRIVSSFGGQTALQRIQNTGGRQARQADD